MAKFKKKMKKLITDPKLFFKDAVRKRQGSVNIVKPAVKERNTSSVPAKKAASNKSKKVEPIVFAEIEEIDYFKKNKNTVSYYKKQVKNNMLSTVILTPKTNKMLVHRPLWNGVLKNRDFIGFRDKFIFCFYYHPKKGYSDYKFLKTIFESDTAFRGNMLSDIRNLVVVDPVDLTAFALKKSSINTNLIVILTEEFDEYDLIQDNIRNIACIIKDEKLDIDLKNANRVEEYINFLSTTEILKRLIVEYNKKEFDLLLPAIGHIDNIVDNIDELNKMTDAVVFLSKYKQQPFKTFNEFIDNNIDNIQAVYVKESVFHTYKDLILNQDKRQLLLNTLKDGVRYECITA